ncbi:MAG: hypothetical protein KF729_17405 [Sandaracinaceae bacterium]|nr:hypothetical protein [Sandaracinaceae bacterium]
MTEPTNGTPSHGAPPSPPGIEPLRGALRATSARVRLTRAIAAGSLFAVVAAGLAALAVALVKTGALGEREATPWLIGAALAPGLGALIGLLRPLAPLTSAKLLDRAHDLHDRVSNAVSFAGEPERTAFMDAAIEDAVAHARALSPKAAMPIRAPAELWLALGLAAGVAGLAALEVPHTWEEHLARASGIIPVEVHEDELEAYRSHLRDLLADPETDAPVRAAAQEMNRIIEDLADQRLDREESLRRLADLERRLAETRPADAQLLADALRELGEDLRRAELAQELSAALRESDAARAEAELRRLSERLREEQARRQDLEALRRALERAAERRADDRSAEIARQQEQLQRLLQRQREQNREATPQERRLLDRRQRELDRLRREHQDAAERQRQLERLRRELSQSAQALQRQDRDAAANDLERGAEDLNRMAREQLSEQEMRQLQEQLQQLREAIRRAQERQAQNGGRQGQQGQQGRGQGAGRMDRFVLRARGQGDGDGIPLGLPGQGQPGPQGQQGQPGRGGQQGQQGQGGQQQQMLTLGGSGEGNATLELPGMGQAQQRPGQGEGAPQPGPGAGTGTDPTRLDDPSRLAGTHRTVRVQGEQSEGPSRSEVIRTSGQRGFASRDYRDTYTDYRGHAEEVLERDEVPPGRRFFVRRYFQLIRPRD